MATLHPQTPGANPPLSQIHSHYQSSSVHPNAMNQLGSQPVCLLCQSATSNCGPVPDTAPKLNLQHSIFQHDYHEILLHECLGQRKRDREATNSSQLDLITDLKIKIAVLENELQRSKLDKEAARNGLAVVIEALARNSPLASQSTHFPAASSHGNGTDFRAARSDNVERARASKAIQELELEVEMLRRTNKRLSRQLQLHKNEPKCLGRKIACSNCSPWGLRDRMVLEEMSKHHILGSLSSEVSFHEEDKITCGGPQFDSETSAGNKNELSSSLSALDEQRGISYDSSFNSSTPIGRPICDPDYGIQSLSDLIGQETADTVQERAVDEEKGFERIPEGVIDLEGDDALDEVILEEAKRFQKIPDISVVQTGISIKESLPVGDHDLVAENELAVGGHGLWEYGRLNTPSGCWNTWEQRDSAIQIHQQVCDRNNRFPLFFKHDIQYEPREADRNYLRTVLISNLPKEIELREVLTRVRGGSITNAILADTLKMNGSKSAIIVFSSASDASWYFNFCEMHHIQFPTSQLEGEDELQPASVVLLSTATYPTEQRAPGRSRCLSIPAFPRHISISGLERTLACGNAYRAAALVEIWLDEYRTLHLEFSSTAAAGSAFAILTNWQCYRGLNVLFERDPCAGALEELFAKVEFRKPMFPQGGFHDDVVEVAENEVDLEERMKWGTNSGCQRQEDFALAATNGDSTSFSGAEFTESSGAEKVCAEDTLTRQFGDIKDPVFQSECSTSSSPEVTKLKNLNIEARVTAILTPDLNEKMANRDSACWVDNTPPVGLAGSRFATLVARSEDRRSGSGSVATRKSADSSTIGHLKSQKGYGMECLKCEFKVVGEPNGVRKVSEEDDATLPITREVIGPFQDPASDCPYMTNYTNPQTVLQIPIPEQLQSRTFRSSPVEKNVSKKGYTDRTQPQPPKNPVLAGSRGSGQFFTGEKISVKCAPFDIQVKETGLGFLVESKNGDKMNLDEIVLESDIGSEEEDLN